MVRGKGLGRPSSEWVKGNAPQLLLVLSLLLVLLPIGVLFYRAGDTYSRTDVIITVATVLYTSLTGALLWVTYFAYRPIVTMYTERQGHQVYLIVANTGQRPAADVKPSFSTPIMVNGEDLTKTIGIFKYPIGAIPPGGAITTGFGFGTQLFPDDPSEEQLAQGTDEQSDISLEENAAERLEDSRRDSPLTTTLRAEGIVSYLDQVNNRSYKHGIVLDARYLEGLSWFTSSRDRELERNIRDSRNELRAIRRLLNNKIE